MRRDGGLKVGSIRERHAPAFVGATVLLAVVLVLAGPRRSLNVDRATWNAPDTSAVDAPAAAARLTVDGDSTPRANGAAGPTHVGMRNVDLYVDPEIVLHIRHMRGTLRSRNGGLVVFDDKESLVFRLAFAEVALTAKDLGTLMNKYVFGYPGAPLRNLSVTIAGNEIVQRGRLKKGIQFPFEMRATVAATPDGRIRIHPTRMKVLGIPANGVMKLFRLSLNDVVNLRGAKGAQADGNDIILDPALILPPPAIEGRVTSVRIEGDRLVQVFGSKAAGDALGPLPIPDPSAPNYMFYRGGTLRFGKLLMLDADMQIVDLDTRDPFGFFLDRYLEQLVAGYSKTMRDSGLEVFMKDIDKLPASR